MQNWAWASVAAFKKANLEVPSTWDEYIADLPKLKEAGVIPFAVGGDGGGWQVSLLATRGPPVDDFEIGCHGRAGRKCDRSREGGGQ
jgi:ABC-type glycerol-3-phosphate transport system substrate-binding protein